jgi:NAD kinase
MEGSTRQEVNMISLNEVFMAEKNASKISSYRIKADDIDIGSFKSSGIIISTGTGSSGWLYGAKRITGKRVHEICNEVLKRSRG